MRVEGSSKLVGTPFVTTLLATATSIAWSESSMVMAAEKSAKPDLPFKSKDHIPCISQGPTTLPDMVSGE
jgi:hypothetical protein